MDPRVLMHLADEALYGAKRGGRDRTLAAGEVSAREQMRIEERFQSYQVALTY